MSENNTTQTTENTTTTTTSNSVTDTTTKTGTSTSSEFVDDPVEKKETFTFTSDEQVMSDKQYLDSSIDEILNLIKNNSLMAKHSVEQDFTSTTRTPSDEPRIVSNIMDAIALALEKLEAEMKAVKNVGTAIQNTDFSDAHLASSLGFELLSKQYADVATVGSGTNTPKYDGDKALTEETAKYKQQKEQQSGSSSGGQSGGQSGYPSGGNEGGTSGGTTPTPTPNTPQSNTPQSNTPQSNTPESNTPQSNTPETNTPQENTPQEQQQEGGHTTIINNYYYNNRGGGGGGGRYTEPAPVVETPPAEEPVVEEPVIEPIIETEPEPVIEEPPIEEIIEEPEEEEIIEEPIAQTIPVQPDQSKSSNTLRKIGVATLVGAGIGAAAYGAHEVMKHKEEKDDYYSNDEEDYATYGYDNDSGEE